MDTPEDEAKCQEEYVRQLTADCPAYAPDERQSAFFAVMDEVKKQMPDMEPISMAGFPASHVNLGWLKDKSLRACEELMHDHDRGPRYVARVIEMLVDRTAQRLRELVVHVDEEIEAIEVRFSTKDDFGYYRYEFFIPYVEPEMPEEDEDEDENGA